MRGNRGRAGIGTILFLAALGVTLVVLGALLPVGTGAIDPAVLAEAGKETGEFAAAGDGWREAEKPGTARVFALAEQRLAMMEDGEFPVKPVAEESEKPVGSLAVWGGYDPFLQQIFGENPPRLAVENPPVIPLFISREARERLRGFLENSGKPGVRAIMETRGVESANRFMPVGSAAGQPLEATILLTGLLLQGNHFSPELAEEVRRLAEEASRENRLGNLETVYLDIFALGVRMQWQPLADLLPLLPDREALRRTAHLTQVLEEDWPVFVAGALWVRNPAELSRFLVERGETGLADLRRAMLAGEGAVRLLASRQEPVEAPALRKRFGELPVAFPRLALLSPQAATAGKALALFGGMLAIFLALNLAPQWWTRGRVLGRPFSFTLLQSGLLALALALVVFVFNEPLLADTGQKSEFRIAIPISIATALTGTTPETGARIDMDQSSLISLTSFLAIQLIIYVVCWVKMMEIRRQPIPSRLKLSLLENEDNLFDAGLYVGLAGTVGSMIALALGFESGGMMAAYSSTLFGIVFVALFKICHLRPYRRRLILETQASEG